MTTPLWDLFAKIALHKKDKLAIIDAITGYTLTYSELVEKSSDCANTLAKYDVSTVAFIGEPVIRTIPFILACAKLEICFVPLNENETETTLLDVLSQLPGPIMIISTKMLKDFQRFDIPSKFKFSGINTYLLDGVHECNNVLPFIITHSSGSTGKPKAVSFTQTTKLKRTLQSIKLFNIPDHEMVLSASPMHHSLGQRHFLVALISGATLVKAYPFNVTTWINTVKDYQITFTIPVSTHLKILKPTLTDNPKILSSLRCLVTSSAPAEAEFKNILLNALNCEFWEIYGMTETACATAVRYTKGQNTAHLGKSIKGTTLRINYEDNQNYGEIEIMSDCFCDGYWGDMQLWHQSQTSDGYFRTGDLGTLDSDGQLVYLGRTNESFESGGLLIFPANIERIFAEIPEITDCVVFGIPNKIFGHIVCLAYTTNGHICQRDLITHARRKLPKHHWPAKLIHYDCFPMLPSGKINKQLLIKHQSKF